MAKTPCYDALITQAEERLNNAPLPQRAKHERLYRYLIQRFARFIVRRCGVPNSGQRPALRNKNKRPAPLTQRNTGGAK